ncbi:MAG TPA: hypothetical protein VKK79_01030 [Candidatus Lokiarchaeia archaeon]|nr:hypothetical protein [Candidatus Lokiarchaeia archaeon]
MLQKTLDQLHLLWARQKEFAPRVWRNVLWLEQQISPKTRRIQNIFGITRSGLVLWWEGNTQHTGSIEKFLKNFTGMLHEADIQQHAQDVLLLVTPANKITLKQLLACRNAEIRSQVFHRCGNNIFLRDGETRVVDIDEESRLIKINKGGFETSFRILEVTDSTSKQKYFLRVPTTMRTCREAVAWTFRLRPEEYQPIKET